MSDPSLPLSPQCQIPPSPYLPNVRSLPPPISPMSDPSLYLPNVRSLPPPISPMLILYVICQYPNIHNDTCPRDCNDRCTHEPWLSSLARDHSQCNEITASTMRSQPVQWDHNQCNEITASAMRSHPGQWDHTQGNVITASAMIYQPVQWDHNQSNEIAPSAMTSHQVEWNCSQCNEITSGAMWSHPVQWNHTQYNEIASSAMQLNPLWWDCTQCNEIAPSAMRSHPLQWITHQPCLSAWRRLQPSPASAPVLSSAVLAGSSVAPRSPCGAVRWAAPWQRCRPWDAAGSPSAWVEGPAYGASASTLRATHKQITCTVR